MSIKIKSQKNLARIAGGLFFIWILTGIYGIFYIPTQITMTGDANTVAQNILSNEFLFRTGILNNLISSLIWIILVLIFYRLFKSVNERYAKLLVAFVIVQIPVVFISEAFNITSLMLFKGEILKAFEISQRQELAVLFLNINEYLVLTLILYWGLWLLPLGSLVYKSGFLPRFIGIWLLINGIAYLVMSFTCIMLPDYKELVYKIIFPAMFGEVILMLWLLIKGIKIEEKDL